MVVKLRVNQKSISTKIKKLEEDTEDRIKMVLKDIAEDLSVRTPVDTGAYAESFSVRPSSDSGGRSRTSRGRPRNQPAEQFQGIALSNMISDINALQILDERSVRFRNRAPHADQVEDRHQVFGATKDRFR